MSRPYKYRQASKFAAPVDPDRCPAMVHESGRGVGFYQCARKRGDNEEGWCHQHDPDASTGERHYRVWTNYGGRIELVSANVISKGKVEAKVESTPATDYRVRMKIADLCFTPEEAWERFVAKARAEVDRTARRHSEANLAAAEAEKARAIWEREQEGKR